ncbi:MAG: ferritin-like domain-containing protein [Anaerolineales bacterium]|jgi:bacterioferritin
MEKEALIKASSEDLFGKLQAVIQYLTSSTKVTGPWRRQLVIFVLTEVQDKLMHAHFFSDKIAAPGGNPSSEPRPVPAAEDATAMLEAILEAELRAGKDYEKHAEQAEEYGDRRLAVQLEDMVRDETGHAEETQMLLKNRV